MRLHTADHFLSRLQMDSRLRLPITRSYAQTFPGPDLLRPTGKLCDAAPLPVLAPDLSVAAVYFWSGSSVRAMGI